MKSLFKKHVSDSIVKSENQDMYGVIQKIIYDSKMEKEIEIDKNSVERLKTRKNCICKFKDKQGKTYFFKNYLDENSKQIESVYNAIEPRKIDILPRIYCKGNNERGFYIIEEEIKGQTIEEYIYDHKTGCCSIIEILQIIRELCRGIDKFHDFLFVHRDLSPANIIVCKEEDELTVKIIDLECTYIVHAKEGYNQGRPMGTRPYIAPEAINFSTIIDRRTDIYSIGSFLKEIVNKTGVLKDYDISIKEKLYSIITKACCETQDNRYATAKELCVALNEIETIIYLDERLNDYARSNKNISLFTFYNDKKEILAKLHNDENKQDEVIYLIYNTKNRTSIRFSLESFKYVKGEIEGLSNPVKDLFLKKNEDTQIKNIKTKASFSTMIAVERTQRNQLRILHEFKENGAEHREIYTYSLGSFDVGEIESLLSLIIETRKMLYSTKSRIEYYESEYDKMTMSKTNETMKLSYLILLGEKIKSLYMNTSGKKKWSRKLGEIYYKYATTMENSYKLDRNEKEKKKIVEAYDKAVECEYDLAEEALKNFISKNDGKTVT